MASTLSGQQWFVARALPGATCSSSAVHRVRCVADMVSLHYQHDDDSISHHHWANQPCSAGDNVTDRPHIQEDTPSARCCSSSAPVFVCLRRVLALRSRGGAVTTFDNVLPRTHVGK